MNDSSVSLGDIFAAASARSASLVPETAGYLTLAIADASSRMPVRLDPSDVFLTTEGDVALQSRGDVVSPIEGARLLRERLSALLSVSIGSLSGLAAAARERSEGTRCVDDVALEIESALIPINRAAARRALARLARETLRVRESGALSAANIPKMPFSAHAPAQPHAAPRQAAPPPLPSARRPAAPASPSSIAAPPPPPSVASPARHEGPPPARPPSPGERMLENLRDRRTRSRGWLVPSVPPGASLAAVISAPLTLPKLPTPARIVQPEEAEPVQRAFVRPLAVIPRPVLHLAGAPNELRIGAGGVGEIWAPSRTVAISGRITELAPQGQDESSSASISPDISVAALGAADSDEPPLTSSSDSDEPPITSFSEPPSEAPPEAQFELVEASPDPSLPIGEASPSLSFGELHEPLSWGMSELEPSAKLADSVEPPLEAEAQLAEESASTKTTVIHADAASVIPFLDSALLCDDESAPLAGEHSPSAALDDDDDGRSMSLVTIEIAPPMDAPQRWTATPTIAMVTTPEPDELSEPTIATETSNILRITRPWPSLWTYELSAQPNAAVIMTRAPTSAPSETAIPEPVIEAAASDDSERAPEPTHEEPLAEAAGDVPEAPVEAGVEAADEGLVEAADEGLAAADEEGLAAADERMTIADVPRELTADERVTIAEMPQRASNEAAAPLTEAPVRAAEPEPRACAEPAAPAPSRPPAPTIAFTRADELLLRFGMSSDSESSVRSALKGLRAIADLDLTPSMAPPVAAPIIQSPRAATPEPPGVMAAEDETPPATSPPPISTPIRRPPRGRALVSAAAFAGGLAAATALLHVRPDFPEGVVALVAEVLPGGRPAPSPEGAPPNVDRHAPSPEGASPAGARSPQGGVDPARALPAPSP